MAEPTTKAVDQFWLAVVEGSVDRVRHCLRTDGVPVDLRNASGDTALTLAAELGNLAVVHFLLESGARPEAGRRSALYTAASAGHAIIVGALADAGADVNYKTQDGLTPVYAAVLDQRLEVLDTLISCRADVNLVDANQISPLYMAAHKGLDSVAITLIDAGADPDIAASDGSTPLFVAAAGGHLDVVRVLLAGGANPDAAKNTGATAVFMAAQNGRLDILMELEDGKANLDVPKNNGATPLIVAAQQNLVDVVCFLIERGANLNAVMTDNVTALVMALDKGAIAAAMRLLDAGADPHIARTGGFAPIHLAVEQGAVEVVERLLAAGVDVNAQRVNGITPLMLAAARGAINVLEVLLLAEADPDKGSCDGRTALYEAAKHGHANCVKLLLDAGADKSLPRDAKYTPLYIAAISNHPDVVQLLLDHQDIMLFEQHPDQLGDMLCFAAHCDNAPLLELLLAMKPRRIDDLGLLGRTGYRTAAMERRRRAMTTLLRHGAWPFQEQQLDRSASLQGKVLDIHVTRDDVAVADIPRVIARHAAELNDDSRDPLRRTPLFTACRLGRVTWAHEMLLAGAQINHQDVDGWTALHEAVWFSQHETVQLLLTRGAKVELLANRTLAERDDPFGLTTVVAPSYLLGLQPMSNVNARTFAGETPLSLALEVQRRVAAMDSHQTPRLTDNRCARLLLANGGQLPERMRPRLQLAALMLLICALLPALYLAGLAWPACSVAELHTRLSDVATRRRSWLVPAAGFLLISPVLVVVLPIVLPTAGLAVRAATAASAPLLLLLVLTLAYYKARRDPVFSRIKDPSQGIVLSLRSGRVLETLRNVMQAAILAWNAFQLAAVALSHPGIPWPEGFPVGRVFALTALLEAQDARVDILRFAAVTAGILTAYAICVYVMTHVLVLTSGARAPNAEPSDQPWLRLRFDFLTDAFMRNVPTWTVLPALAWALTAPLVFQTVRLVMCASPMAMHLFPQCGSLLHLLASAVAVTLLLVHVVTLMMTSHMLNEAPRYPDILVTIAFRWQQLMSLLVVMSVAAIARNTLPVFVTIALVAAVALVIILVVVRAPPCWLVSSINLLLVAAYATVLWCAGAALLAVFLNDPADTSSVLVLSAGLLAIGIIIVLALLVQPYLSALNLLPVTRSPSFALDQQVRMQIIKSQPINLATSVDA